MSDSPYLKSRPIRVGGLTIGGGSRIAVQSMCNTDTADRGATLAQVLALQAAGCDVVRIALPRRGDAATITYVKERVSIPVVADVHFDYRIALEAVAAGADKIRINPGNIAPDGNFDRVRQVARACTTAGIPIRIGVNGGSLERHILARYGGPTPEALAESALEYVRLMESFDFDQLVISVKTSNVFNSIRACRLLAQQCDYPQHIGLTEAGTQHTGTLKNAAAIGALLADGIGDTIRVSLTADPVAEVEEGIALLRALQLYPSGVNIISCPACGRCRVDLIGLADEVERLIREHGVTARLNVAVMGCSVNGPGEAREADVGLYGGDGEVLLFRRGEIIGKAKQEDAARRLVEEVERMTASQ